MSEKVNIIDEENIKIVLNTVKINDYNLEYNYIYNSYDIEKFSVIVNIIVSKDDYDNKCTSCLQKLILSLVKTRNKETNIVAITFNYRKQEFM